MKKAWEEAQPGRAAKAFKNHEDYLTKNLVEVGMNQAVLDSVLESFNLTTEPPAIFLKEKVPLMDLTPYIKNSNIDPKYLSSTLLNQRQELKDQEVEEYQWNRHKGEEWLENEKSSLKVLRYKQIEMCQQMQSKLDGCREYFYQQREDFRQSCIKMMEENQVEVEEKEVKTLRAKISKKGGGNTKAPEKASTKGKR
ncbi:hypothetical protein Ahia01_001082400 [Argonauta hians]